MDKRLGMKIRVKKYCVMDCTGDGLDSFNCIYVTEKRELYIRFGLKYSFVLFKISELF